MAGDVPGEELPPEDKGRGFLEQKPWRRALIVAAGPAFNLVFPVLVYLAVFSGFPQMSTRVGSVVPGLPAAQAHLQPGDKVVAVNGHPVVAWLQLLHELE